MENIKSGKEFKMADVSAIDEEYISDLAMYWYFLSIQFDSAGSGRSDQLADELIKHGTQLKRLLQYGCYTCRNPLNVSVGNSTSFNVWLDANGDIRVSKLIRS
jgi:hypothetical protein